jgi:hypothetical protein
MGCPCELTVQLQFKSDSAELADTDKARLDKAAETLQRLHWVSGTIGATRMQLASLTTTTNCPSNAPRPCVITCCRKASVTSA